MSRLCQTQPNPTEAEFMWVVVFDWNVDNPKPFLIDVKENFLDAIPESWYKKKWQPMHRVQKVRFNAYPDRVMSVFCKVEKSK